MFIKDWPKRFLKTILLHLSHHQVCKTPTHTELFFFIPRGVDRTTRQEHSVYQGAGRRRMAPDVSVSLQVELLIENEAEKDYLFDVLRMYHQ